MIDDGLLQARGDMVRSREADTSAGKTNGHGASPRRR